MRKIQFRTFACKFSMLGYRRAFEYYITSMAGSSDVVQGFNEMRLGWNNDRTTRTRNLVRDTLYGGNDTIYHLSTGMAAMAGSALRPYVMPKKNPALAGGEQKDIAKKAAMGADDAVGGANRNIVDNMDEIAEDIIDINRQYSNGVEMNNSIENILNSAS